MKKIFSLYLLIPVIFSYGYLQARTQTTLDYQNRIHPEISSNFMVVSQNEHATKAGYEVLRRGGNAVDAAVAVGFALAVTLPRAGNLGGGGFVLLIHSPPIQYGRALLSTTVPKNVAIPPLPPLSET